MTFAISANGSTAGVESAGSLASDFGATVMTFGGAEVAGWATGVAAASATAAKSMVVKTPPLKRSF
ncbi:hypothetical protein H9L12_00450 [Sphingomonas rhizophila]|uniref:Uncharacterized protein n=1 Tax=Sphingomonas rhizophila TaxID=2071607 RepID=A0A7G9SBE3_9SPHN|nr:hypothetical protein [Sphingomonas rhizophila]QNN65168.1 hypothetical protein H9L12_00450 [Sphingomonas rhizophila]